MAAQIFFGAIVIMFISTTAHVGKPFDFPTQICVAPAYSLGIPAINLYRVLRAYVWLADEVGPAAYWGNLSRWDTITHGTLNAFTTWVGDCLVVSSQVQASDCHFTCITCRFTDAILCGITTFRSSCCPLLWLL
jgi:hypothetical protein